MSAVKNKPRTFVTTLFALGAMFAGGSAFAQANGHLEVTTIVEKEIVVEADNGETTTQLVEAESVVPGEKVVYTITFKNVGDASAENVVITNPISESLTYVAGSASNGSMVVEFSTDGGKSFGIASELRIVDNGVERLATTQDYTHVRWVMKSELEVGEEGSASFAAVLQ